MSCPRAKGSGRTQWKAFPSKPTWFAPNPVIG